MCSRKFNDREMIEAHIQRIVRNVGDQYAFSVQPAKQRWHGIVRDVSSKLQHLQHSGVLTGFLVRCDEETNDGATNGNVVEVVYTIPRRVETMMLCVSLSE